jgi:HD-GYP domain-containing protein (c-di-GMP phosphodiesterase class II)
MSTRKISIARLKKGMFIHELDISWMKSPFLRHQRKISSQNDILLLIKAGVKTLTIDLSRGDDIQVETAQSEHSSEVETAIENDQQDKASSSSSSEEQTPLNEELIVAKLLQAKIQKLVNKLTVLVREGQALSLEAINPAIDEACDSLKRNDQALLTILHLHRQDIKLSDHGFGVFSVVLLLAMRLGCSEEEMNALGVAALLHDTGWSRLPMHLVGKSKAYTLAEWRLIHQHPAIVENVLNKSKGFSKTIKTLVRQHHELNDGSGYPDKLKKGQIHKLTEVLQLADYYDELIHGLSDKAGMLPANALKILYHAAHKGLYSETLVSELIHIMGIYPLTSAVRLNTGEKVIVLEIDKQKPLLPRVQVVYESNGKQCVPQRIIDLAHQEENYSIKEVIDPLDKNEDPLGLLRIMEV